MPEALSVESIYAQIRAAFEGRVTPESRIIVKYNGDVLVIYDPKDSFSLLISYLINKCEPKSESGDGKLRLRFKKFSSKINETWGGLYDIIDEDLDVEESCEAIEPEKMIKNLLLKGCPAEMILSWINQSVKLSRLKITKQFKIYLTDYENEEIKMGPLPKTVFLFFLRHPEGVMFSHLQDYREELKMIYGHVCTNDDPQRMEESINRLTLISIRTSAIVS